MCPVRVEVDDSYIRDLGPGKDSMVIRVDERTVPITYYGDQTGGSVVINGVLFNNKLERPNDEIIHTFTISYGNSLLKGMTAVVSHNIKLIRK